MNKLTQKGLLTAARGQSLVEMALTAPILIFMLIGVFEVGWALRGYLVLVNANREITRFAVRPGYLDFSTQADVDESFQTVRDWVDTTITGQLPLDFDEASGNATLIISHLVVDTGWPCAPNDDPDVPGPFKGECDCSKFDPNDADNYDPDYDKTFGMDDIIIHPGMNNYEYQAQRFGPTSTVTSNRDTRIEYDALVQELRDNNNNFNCEIIKKNGVPSANNAIITELFYDQPQLFGFPIIANPYTDPVPLYTHTTMRLISAARSGGTVEGSIIRGIDTVGPICFTYPMFVGDDVVDNAQVNIIENGWLIWDISAYPDPPLISNAGDYLAFALKFPQMSLNDSPPGGIQPGLSVDKVTATFPDLQETVEALEDQQIVIPTSSSPGNNPVEINGFVLVTIQDPTDVDLANGEILAQVDRTSALPGACPAP